MTRRTSIVEQLSAYFAEKGAPMTADEYKNAEDAPVRFQLIKRNIGSWSRLLNMVNKYTETPQEAPVVQEPEPEAPAEEPVVEQKEPEQQPEPEVPAETKKPVKG